MNNFFYLSLFLFFIISSKSHAENMCSSSSSSADNGTIYDSGGASGYYSNDENCGFLIQPSSSPTSITLSFSQFSVEPDSSGSFWDYLEVYDGTSTSGTLLGRFYGSSLPSNITASSGSMYLRFISDSSLVYSGFSASWTSTTSSTACNTVKDSFSNLSYSNNNGIQNWSNSWQEVGESDGVSAGKARVRNDLCSSGYCLRLGTPSEVPHSSYSNRGVSRQADLFGSTSATLNFNYFTGVRSGTSTVILSVSNNGGSSWINLKTYTISSTNFSANPESFDLTPYISANTQIRFLGSGSSSSVTGMYIDDIQIEACGSSSGGDTAATAFNCVENGSNGISGKLFTKTTAQPFSFDIVALQDASTIETSFASGADHTVTVELVNAETAASCDSYPTLSPAASQSINMISSDAGTKASANMNSSTAYSKVKCRVTDTTDSPSVIGCSTDSFSIRPSTISISSNLTNTGSTGTPKAKTAENFTLIATTTTGYNGTPSVNTSNIQAHLGAIQTGNISGTFSPANSATGIAIGTTFNYSEVGSFRFTAEGVYDDSFTAVDQASDCTDDFSNTPDSTGKVGCKFGNTSTTDYFGRFTPDHFDVTLNTPIFAASCGTFTYIGQPVKYTTQPIATITAKNSAGVTTQNYTGDFWKINPTDTTYGFTPFYSINSHSLTILESSAPSYSDNGNGTGTLTFADTSNNILAISKSTLTPPFDAEITLSFNLSDTDAIVVANVNSLAQPNPVSFGTSSSGINFNNKAHRWGRAVLTNVHGSELTPLNIPVTTEYYDGTNFIANSADNCTTFTLENDFSISDTADYNCSFSSQTTPVIIGSGSIKASMSNTQLSSGSSNLILSNNSNTTLGPRAGNTGHVDITSKLDSLSWLYYDWDANSIHDNCPSARATFGIYQGNTKQIYFREVY